MVHLLSGFVANPDAITVPIMHASFKGEVKICIRLCCPSNLSSKMQYDDYYWDKGVPKGRALSEAKAAITYKIQDDPYRKRYSIEQYEGKTFQKILYDSALFDFRSLFKGEDASWQREVLSETATSALTLIRNMEERIILREELHYDTEGKCTGCTLFSCHGVPIGTQTICDKPFIGVEFRDISGRLVLQKEYEKNKETGEFGSLLREVVSFKHLSS